MTVLKLLAGLAAAYLLLVAAMALAQGWLLFPRWAMPGGPAALPATAEPLAAEAATGERLAGHLLPADPPAPPDAPLVLGFGGNAWDAAALAAHLAELFPDRDVAAFHYRGYGPSEGRPTARALLEDALAVHDHLAATRAPAGIVAVGLSVGAGPAAHLAAERPLAGLVLVTPFDSLAALAREHYPWAPVGLLLRHRMEVAEAVAAAAVPVALVAAGRDTIVPPRRTAPLRGAARRLVLDRTIPGAGHNDLYGHPAYHAAMREALARLEAEPRPAP